MSQFPADPPPALPPLPPNVWLHGAFALLLLVLAHLAQWLLVICAVLQFLWMLLGKERNAGIARFAQDLGRWQAATACFAGGAADEKPFPWSNWPV